MNRNLPHDAALPQLALAFDPERMAGVFERMLGGARVVDCAVERSKYRLGRNCMVLYRTRIAQAGAAPREQLFAVGLYAPEEARSRYAKAQRASLVRPAVGEPVHLLAEHNMVAWAYPNERKLASLPLLADEARMRGEVLPALVRARWGDAVRLKSATLRRAGYFPEHAYCFRAELALEGGAAPAEWVVYGKTSHDDRGARTDAAMRALWALPEARRTSLGLARPLGYDAALNVLWQEAVPGRTVEARLQDGESACESACAMLAEVGRATAELHAVPLAGLPALTQADILAKVAESARLIGAAEPAIARELAALCEALLASAPEHAEDVTLHGDLHLNNVLFEDGRLFMVDFDSLRHGPAAIELGSLVAALIYRGALHAWPQADTAAGIDAFIGAYNARAARAVPLREIAWQAAAALLHERMARCLSSLKPGRYDLIGTLLAQAVALCVRARDLGAADTLFAGRACS